MKSLVSLLVSRLKAWFFRNSPSCGSRDHQFEALEPRILYSAAPVDAPEPAPAEAEAAQAAEAPAPAAQAPAAEQASSSATNASGEATATPEPVGATAIPADQEVSLVDVSSDSRQSVSFQAAEGTENLQLSLDADGNVQISEEGVVTFRQSADSIRDLSIHGNALDNHLTVDFSNGSPVPELGLSYHGHGNVTDYPGDVLSVTGLAEGTDVGYETAETDGEGAGFNGTVHVGDDKIQFFGLEPITLVGAGGTLTVDGTATPTTTTLTLGDLAPAGDGINRISGDGGFEETTFSGFDNLTLRGGDGEETITLNAIDVGGGPSLATVTLDGNNTGATDAASVDTFDLVGPFAGDLTVQSDDNDIIRVAGAGDGAFVVNNATLGAGSVQFDINGTTAGTNHDTITATTVDITGATLDISGAHAATTGEQFTLISTTGGVTGTFAGLAEGATIANFLGSGLDATITYAGGGGNDVVLTVAAPRPATDDTYLVADTGTTTIPASAGVLSNDNFITAASLTLNYDANAPGSAVGSSWRGGVASNDWNFGGDVTLEDVTGGNNTRDGITHAYRFTGGAGAENQGLNDLAGDPSNDSATWEFWLRPDDLGDGNQIIFESGGAGDGMAVWYQKGTDDDGDGTIRFTVDDGGVQRTLAAAIDRSDFHHVVAVYSKDDVGLTDRVELYINGVSIDSDATTTDLDDWDGGDPSGIGNQGASGLAQGASNGEFQGDISVFRFYEAALTQDQIDNNYNAVNSPNTVTEINGVGANVGNPLALTNGTVTVNADGSLTYTATAAGNDSFTYTAFDGVSLYEATVNVNQLANTAPVANDDPGETTNESTAILIDVLGNDVDPDAGQSRIVTVPATSANGVPLAVTASGEVRYDPTVALDGLVGGGILVDTFTYTFSDGVASDTATVTVTVSGESDTGVAGDDTASTDEDTAVSGNVLLNDTDIDSVTAGADLNFDASADLDGAEWENTGEAAAGWVLNSNAGAAPLLTAVTSGHAGITQAYQMTGGAIGGNNAFKLQDSNGNDVSLQNLGGDATDESATFEIWFKPDSLPNAGNRQILFEDGGGTGIGLFIEGNDLVAKKLPGSATGDRLAVDISALAGDFIQAVLTFDRSTNPDQMELFVNGVSAGTFGTNNGGDWSGGDPLAVGGRGGANVGGQGGGDSSSVSFQGQVAAFRFYRNEILNLAQVNQNYRAVNQGNILRVSEVEGQAVDVGNEITLASGAKVTLNANGTFDYNPNGAFEHLTAFQTATDSFEYTVSDGVDSTTATVTVTLDGINDLPIARDNPQIWRVGIDNGNNSEFPNEGANTDEHYYFAGTYPSRADGSLDVSPSADEAFNTFDRALTSGDPNNFIHFNLTPDQADDNLRLTVDVVQSNIPVGGIDFEVLFNGVSVLSQNLTADGVLTADFTAVSVSATTGENIIEVRRTDGNGGWMQFDHITLQSVDEINAYTTDENNSLTVTNPGLTGNDFDADTTVQILSADTTSAAGAAVSVVGQTNIGEVGQLTVDGTVQTVTLNQTYTNAVVIAMVEQATAAVDVNDDPNTANARVFNVTGNSFDIQLQSPATGSPGFPIAETVNYIVLEAGTYELANGARLEAGTILANATGNNNIAFTGGQFSSTPIALTQVMSQNDPSYVNSRHQANVSATGVDIFLEPVQGGAAHAAGETIGFVAIEQSFGTIGTLLYEAGVTGNIADADGGAVSFINTYTAAPLFVGSQQTINGSDPSGTRFRYNGTGVIVESDEDRADTGDTETAHAAEAIGFFAFEATTGFLQGVAVGGTSGGFTYDPGNLFQNLGENDTATDTFDYVITDGMGETATATATITINGVNDAPVLASGTGDFNSVSISDYTNDGDLVSTLINGQISDVDDNSVEGIAVTGITVDAPGTGKFQFSTDAGASWNDFAAPSDLAALLLRAEDRVRFVPDGSNLTGGSINFRAWDQTGTTAGDEGTTVDITNDFSGGGNATPFSLATESSSVAVANLVLDGNDLIYSASDGAGNVNHLDISIDQSTGELVIVDTNGNPVTTSSNLTDNDPSTNGARVAYNGENLIIRTGIEDDIVNFALMDGFSGALTVEGGDDYDQIFMVGSTLNLAADNNASLDAERFNTINTNINTTGGGTITITGTGGTTNNFAGIYMVSSGLSSEDGVITLDGTGSNSGFYAHGVEFNSTTITSDSTEDTAISITGKGGLGGSGDYGNTGITSFYATITAANGGVVINGTADSSTTSAFNAGAALYATTISGTTLDVTGDGGGGTSYNRGIFLSSGSDLDATDGDATFTGTGGGAGSYNDGIYFEGSSVDASGMLTVSGTANTAPTNSSSNSGVLIYNSNANGGNGLDIDGIGGTGSGGYSYGVSLYNSTTTGGTGAVTIDGTADSSTAGYSNVGTAIQYTTVSGASLAINGTGGGGTFYNRGVLMTSGSATASSGDITITGDSANNTSGGGNDGVQINSTSVTANNGKIDITGDGSTGVANTSANNGIYLSGATFNSVGFSAVGTGGVGSGIDNNGVYMFGGSITTTGSADTVISGIGGAGSGGYNYGTYIYFATINANNSTLDIDGTASSTAGGTNNTGVGLQYSTLNGDSVLVTGLGGSGTNYNRGIYIVGGSATADNGDVNFEGTANAAASGAYNEGINATSTSITSSSGSAIIKGDASTSGSNSHSNHGVYFSSVTANGSAGTTITGTGGTGSSGFSSGVTIYYGTIGVNSSATTITGTANAGAGGSFNVGNSLQYTSVVGSTLGLNGTGGGTGGNNRGVYILGGSATAQSGAMTVIGTSASSTGSTNNGVDIQNATVGGSTSTSITGTGGGGSDYNHGIYMNAITTFGVTPFATTPTAGAGANSEDEAGDFFPQ